MSRSRSSSPRKARVRTPGFAASWWRRHTFRRPDGRYGIVFDDASPFGHRIRIEAKGYLPKESRTFRGKEIDATYDFKLTKGAGPEGLVRLPDGKPAEGAEVFLYTKLNSGYVRNGKPNRRNAEAYARTGPDGKFSLSAQTDPFRLFVFHERGFADVRQSELHDSPEVTLKPWARLEGTLRIGSRPAEDHTVSLIYPHPGRARGAWETWGYLDYQTTTDAEGHFAFEHCLPGSGTVQRSYIVSRTPDMMSTGLSYPLPVELVSGETITVSIGGFARPVIGRIVMPEGDNRRIDWASYDVGAMLAKCDIPFPSELKEPPAEIADVLDRLKDMGNTTQRHALARKWNDWSRRRGDWLNQWRRSDKGKSFLARFAGKLDSEGGFRIEDVPAGNFELRAAIYPPGGPHMPGRPDPIGSVRHLFNVPDMPGGRNDEPLDLGTISVIPWGQPMPSSDRSPDFEVSTLSGKTLRLADSRGKYVLIQFWATWSDPSLTQVPHFKALHQRWAGHAKFVLLGLSLDDDVNALRKYVETQDVAWEQGLLGRESKVASDYGVARSPTRSSSDRMASSSTEEPTRTGWRESWRSFWLDPSDPSGEPLLRAQS